MVESIIQHCVAKGFQDNPEAAAREVGEILDFYVCDNTRLNRLYLAVGRYLIQQNAYHLCELKKAFQECAVRTLAGSDGQSLRISLVSSHLR